MEGNLLLCVSSPIASLPHVKMLIVPPEEGYWMSDKPLVQQALATELADILLKIPDPSSSLLFLKGFWQTIVHEWLGIDRLRWADRNLNLNPHSCLTYRTQNGQVLHVDSAFR